MENRDTLLFAEVCIDCLLIIYFDLYMVYLYNMSFSEQLSTYCLILNDELSPFDSTNNIGLYLTE